MIGNTLLNAVQFVFYVAWLAIVARVILSRLPMAGVRIDPYHPLVRILYQLTDPILDPIRRFATFGMMDFSPIVALFLLEIIRRVLVTLLRSSF